MCVYVSLCIFVCLCVAICVFPIRPPCYSSVFVLSVYALIDGLSQINGKCWEFFRVFMCARVWASVSGGGVIIVWISSSSSSHPGTCRTFRRPHSSPATPKSLCCFPSPTNRPPPPPSPLHRQQAQLVAEGGGGREEIWSNGWMDGGGRGQVLRKPFSKQPFFSLVLFFSPKDGAAKLNC